ncbi:MAG TPA: hypothetical protein VH333_13010 [Pseudonocardiaceae bacterium]|jgi:hypothetical protein|nr:hypothetical protein [Pseudonocardiaceae bacterium]
MAKIILQLAGLSAAHPPVHNLADPTAAPSANSYLVVAIVAAIAVFVALARLLRRMLAMVSHLLSSAGAAVSVLITLIGTGALLLTTVLAVISGR